ncbi:cell division protein FtsA [Candidatus Microgenomates bacterium]|nr:MAG: cell division protein FtsA [Candidatus Microgenomates bacterium]
MTDGKIIVGIDVGTSKVATVIAKVDEFVNILGVSEVKSQGIKKGQIVDIEEAVASINNSLEAAERMAGYSASHIVAAIGGDGVDSHNSKGVVAVSNPDGEIIKTDLVRVIDAAKALSLPQSREIIHVLPRSYIVDGQQGIKDPIGMTGVRLEVDTHIVTVNSVSLRNLEKALSEVGVDVDGIVFSGYSSGLAVLSDTEKELGVVLIDIGAGTTDIAIFIDGSLSYSSVLPIGARHISNDLAIGLRISLESAEKIKLYLSQGEKRRVNIDDEPEEEKKGAKQDEIDLGFLKMPEDLQKVSRKTLVEGIIRPRLNEIFTMIGLEIKKSGYGGQTPAGIVITGGGARTIGVTDSAKRMLTMPVRIGFPTGVKGIIDEVEGNPAFSTVVGLLSFGSKISATQSLPFGVSLPQVPFRLGKFPRKIIDFIKSFIP